MKRLLTAASVAAAFIILPATAGARIAQANQFEGSVAPNGCGAVHNVFVNGPTRISALIAGTNAGGQLVTEVIDAAGVSHGQAYTTTSAGTFGVRVCFFSDGIDSAPI